MTALWQNDHILHIGGETSTPNDPANDADAFRKRIEPWLSSVFQSEHLSLLLGNGFTTGLANCASALPVSMEGNGFDGCPNHEKVAAHAAKLAAEMGRGSANIEDNLSAALALLAGLKILESKDAAPWETAIDRVMRGFIKDVLTTEKGILDGLEKPSGGDGPLARELLVSFLMSFASRTASRERLHIFTTNYDRLIERGCDHAGLRIIDRFVGALEPEFRSSRLHVDMHYMPPGVRGEPRHLEGVVRLTKLHGSLDWRYEKPRLMRAGLPFGADSRHPAIPASP